jgi:hypothetical protein
MHCILPTYVRGCLATLQDCFGGCTDADQGFYGYMDEVCQLPAVSCADMAPQFHAQCPNILCTANTGAHLEYSALSGRYPQVDETQ